MALTLKAAVETADQQGYMELAAALKAAIPRLRIKQIKHIHILNMNEPGATDTEGVLFFTLQGDALADNVVYFQSKEKLYEAAYQMVHILKNEEKLWYEKIIETNLKFNDITLKYPDLATMIKYFNRLMENPVIIYDEFFNIVAITNPLLSEYERDENDLKRYELHNLFYYKQRVMFQNQRDCFTSCNRLLFPVLLGGCLKDIWLFLTFRRLMKKWIK